MHEAGPVPDADTIEVLEEPVPKTMP
ncbi:hypothetical protein NSND_63516 [Nitrospira sp. ND1]|nr:hypothetical protein NSND_63516 [Nitrospira sp. ND1]